jgi:hypothetical protein
LGQGLLFIVGWPETTCRKAAAPPRQKSENLLIWVNVGGPAWVDMEVTTQEVSMALLVAAIVTIFSAFAVAMAYAEVQTRGIYAPGARKE